MNANGDAVSGPSMHPAQLIRPSAKISPVAQRAWRLTRCRRHRDTPGAPWQRVGLVVGGQRRSLGVGQEFSKLVAATMNSPGPVWR